jgi:predicted acetyltransferase
LEADTRVALVRVEERERSALDQLVDEYLAELSTHRERAVGPTDSAGYAYLPLYWEEPGRHPFFLTSRGRRIGFALVREIPAEGVTQMSDFYIAPGARRGGLGRAALGEIWRRFPGPWELQVHPRNEAASVFWPRCIEQFSRGRVERREVEEEDGHRVQYNFEIGGGADLTAR